MTISELYERIIQERKKNPRLTYWKFIPGTNSSVGIYETYDDMENDRPKVIIK